MPDPGGRGCLLIRNRDRDRAAVALELEIAQDLYARGARVARGARGAMCRDSMHQNRFGRFSAGWSAGFPAVLCRIQGGGGVH